MGSTNFRYRATYGFQTNKTVPADFIKLTLFRMGLFGAAHR